MNQDLDDLGLGLAIEQDLQRENLLKSEWQVAQEGPNGDAWADIVRRAEKLGMAPAAVQNGSDALRRQADMPDMAELRRNNPGVASWLVQDSEPLRLTGFDKMRLANGDLDNLGTVENSLRGFARTAVDIPSNAAQLTNSAAAVVPHYGEQAMGLPPQMYKHHDALHDKIEVPPDAFGYQQRYTWDKLKEEPSLANFGGFLFEGSMTSVLPYMLAFTNPYTGVPAAMSIWQMLAECRAENQGLDYPAGDEYYRTGPAAAFSAFGERIGARQAFKQTPSGDWLARARGVGKAGAANTGIEAVQEGQEYAAESTGTKAGFDWGTALDQMAQGAVLGGGTGASVRAVSEAYGAFRAEQTYTQLRESGEAVRNSQTFQRHKPAFQEFLQSATGDTPIYIDLANAEQQLLAEGHDPALVFQQLAPDARLDDLRMLGGEIIVPAYRLLGAADAHWFDSLLLDAKTAANDMTPREARSAAPVDFEKVIAAYQQELDAQTEQDAMTQSYEQVRALVAEQLREAGVAVGDIGADQYATIMAAHLKTIAEARTQAGDPILPHELYEMRQLVIGGESPQVLTKMAEIRRARKGQYPDRRKAYGPTLGEFLSEQGGLMDEGGELSAIDAQDWTKTHRRRLLNPAGMSLETALERVREAGYAITSINQIVPALRAEMNGDAIHAEANYDPDAMDELAYFEELGDYLGQLDLNDELSDLELARKIVNGELPGLTLDQVEIDGAAFTEVQSAYDARIHQLERFIACLTT